jgi:hypothetical protein
MYILTINTISPDRHFYDLRGLDESSSSISFIIHMVTAILPLIDNFWDRMLGTYRNPDADDVDLGIITLIPWADKIARALVASITEFRLAVGENNSDGSGGGAFERYRAAAAGLRRLKKRLAKRIRYGITLGRNKRAS